MPLSPKQKKFCQEYIVDLNATQAAIRAGYSQKTANEQGARLLANVSIKKLVSELKEKRAKRTEITADMVIKELAKIGFSNIQDFIGGSNSISDISTIDKEKAASVSSIETTTTIRGKGEDQYAETSTKIKVWDKTKALEQLGRHLGIFEKDNEQNKPDSNTTFTEIIISKKV